VITTRRSFVAKRVLIAAGTATPALAEQAGAPPGTLSLLHRPGVLVWTRPLPPGTLRTLLVTPEVYLHQRPCGRVVIGEDMGKGERPPDDTSPQACARIMAKAVRWLPALRGEVPERVTLGFRPYPADGLPIVGHLPNMHSAVYVCVVHSGITLAPALAPLVAAEVLSGKPCEEGLLDLYRPGRPAIGAGAAAAGAYDVQMDGVLGASADSEADVHSHKQAPSLCAAGARVGPARAPSPGAGLAHLQGLRHTSKL